MRELRARSIRAATGADEEARRNGWHRGMCWLCKHPDEIVSWVGSARTRFGDLDINACAPCQVWFDQASKEAFAKKDFADLAAR